MTELALVTRDALKKRLSIYHDDDDDDLDFLILAASQAVVDYLDARADVILSLDSSGELTSSSVVPRSVEIATLYLCGVMWRNRDTGGGEFDGTRLPPPVIAFLRPLREPPFA